ncbi:tRNA glutamyl-Q(34) synthetase GluQRS [Faunimonas pinastri]|uniref:tRNA glutamyl-Q(34) synthetase GluQRS n=1 Tax=Faunimonas pinastri TaxID=1855383 RepID=UPI000B8062CE|nr:tRNA glutamyl-Q(34) synthetase GluQRS [Faunimonas pinastri]
MALRSAGQPTFRFAPSPNGYLHLGHAYSGCLNEAAALAASGRFLLRIEDIDRVRARPEYELAILQDLAWLGLDWERPVLRQSDRFDAYRRALAELDRLGLIYPATLSRAEIQAAVSAEEAGGQAWPRDPDGAPLYPGREREWSNSRRREVREGGAPFALRLDMKRALAALAGRGTLRWRERNPLFPADPDVSFSADPARWGDVVLARKETPASYHLSVVVDDAFQGVTHVVRGEDLRPATSVHRLLQVLLGLPEPLYHHHPLILDEFGQKLSKSRGSESLRALRLAGRKADEIRAAIGTPLALAPQEPSPVLS